MKARTFFPAIAVLLAVNQHVASSSNICNSPKCIQEAAKIIDYIDPNANPCVDFHQFACGNFLKNSYGNENLAFKNRIVQENIQELTGLYQETVQENDHKMVKAARKLYQKCADQLQVEDDIRIVKELFKDIGGWPVLEGSTWNEEGFDWLNLTYTLRRLGYDHTALLRVNVVLDPDNRDKHILEIDRGYRRYASPETRENLVRVAVLFGAEDKASEEYATDVYQFLTKMREYQAHDYKKLTVEEIQKSEGIINWLEFINNITGPKFEITKDDYVMFPNYQHIKKLFDLVSNTPKRTQANYMMWTAATPLVLFLASCPGTHGICKPGAQRPLLCLSVTHTKLLTQAPSPIDVLRLRQYLPENKTQKVENLVSNVISAFVEYMSKIQWIDENTRNIVNKIKDAKVVIGMTGNYFDDKILDDSDIDMIDVEDNASFFAFLGQVERNFQSASYTKMNKPIPKYNYAQKMMYNTDVHYSPDTNVLYVPLSATKSFIYDANRPEYLNYATLGTLVASALINNFKSYIEGGESAVAFQKIKDCLKLDMENETTHATQIDLSVTATIKTMVAEHVSYTAYEEWMKINGEGEKLIAIEYTPKQLFWISAASLMCQPIGPSDFQDDYRRYKVYANIYSVSGALRNNPNFAKDFSCPVNSKLNPNNRCALLV